jgi:hypothetical protein
MPSFLHDGLVALLRDRPQLLAALAGFPEAGWEIASPDLGLLVPVERRADALLYNRAARVGLILEVLLAIPKGKKAVLAGYQAVAVQQLGFPVAVVIFAPSRRVARLARQAFHLGGGSVFRAIVIGPDELPVQNDLEDPHLAVLIAVLHARAEDAERAARIALAKLTALDTSQARDYTTLILACVPDALRQALEDTMLGLNLPTPRVFRVLEELEKSEARAEGREEGRESARRDDLRAILRRRFGAVPEWAESRIASASAETLRDWILRCIDAATVEQALAD